MIRQIALTEFQSRDEIHLYARKRQVSESKWLEISVWDDYEGRGGTAGLYSLDEVDRLIASLVEIRKEML